MKRMSALIGAAVIADGRRAGRVSGVVLEGGRQLVGVLIEGALGGSRVISLGQIDVIGDVSLQCSGRGERAGGDCQFSPGRALTTSGRRLGRVSDLIINESHRPRRVYRNIARLYRRPYGRAHNLRRVFAKAANRRCDRGRRVL